MLSKREKLFAAVSSLHGLICPVCRQLLFRQGDNLICAGGHAINVNRRGCVNLLSAQADTFYVARPSAQGQLMTSTEMPRASA